MTDRGGWARGGMVVVALGVASNLVLTFVPDVVPDQVGPVVVYCMTAVIVLVAPLWAYRELIESSRRLQQERRRLRGIEAVGGERSREADVSALWRTATQRVLCFGVGLTSVSQDEEHIRETVGRGVDIDFVMVDPQWLRQQRKVAALAGDYYTESAFVARVEGAYDRLRGLAERYPEEAAGGTVRLHTYRAWVQHSATIVEPWSEDPTGFVEFHVYRRRRAWVRLVLVGLDSGEGDRPYVQQILEEVDQLLGYSLSRPSAVRSVAPRTSA
ncbi:hypothetical protein ACFQBY_18600 [Promicromonospora citrea]|nr:hypothetical protein [Promicromonospora citrea]NNH54934.1 hypothetical protein [Promicromonospora citrea]